MWKIKQAIAAFMYGRYGADKLYWVLVGAWFIITLINRFVGSVLLYILGMAVILFAMFRFFSRNIVKRQCENTEFLKFFGKIKRVFQLFCQRVKDIGKKRYRKCKKCRAVLRLPIKRGTSSVKCPRCGNFMKVTILI